MFQNSIIGFRYIDNDVSSILVKAKAKEDAVKSL